MVCKVIKFSFQKSPCRWRTSSSKFLNLSSTSPMQISEFLWLLSSNLILLCTCPKITKKNYKLYFSRGKTMKRSNMFWTWILSETKPLTPLPYFTLVGQFKLYSWVFMVQSYVKNFFWKDANWYVDQQANWIYIGQFMCVQFWSLQLWVVFVPGWRRSK